MFHKVDPKQSFPEMEEEILKYWEANNIFEKSVAKDAPAGDFVFYEGPPTANGKPGLHHVLARSFKDIIPRYKTMKGYRVARKAGWDTHGLPVELQVEKALGLKNKADIESIVPGDARQSVIEFNKKCKESVWEYRDLWEKLTRRMGYWVDMEHPYVTYENAYIESVWWQLARIAVIKNDKGESLLYKGHKVVPYCYRCGTALSSHEVAQGYKTVKDNSVYVEFELVDAPTPQSDEPSDGSPRAGEQEKVKTYLLAWTTTPWTLPGNVALAVGRDIEYVLLEKKDEGTGPLVRFVVAKDRLESAFGDDKHVIVKTFRGSEMVGQEYEPLYSTAGKDANPYRVVAGDFVTTESGTGIVHIAPAFGEDDANVARENDLPTLHTVDLEGKVSADVPGKGIPVKKLNDKNRYAVDDLIIADLKERGLLFKEEQYEHEYPFCWRCDTPLIYHAKPSWFIEMSSVREELVKNADAINWVPEHIKDGRFGEWLRGIKDWAISRDRYWGTPIPIWECDACDHRMVVESSAQIEKLSGTRPDDLHKPYIDDVEWTCKCGGTMRRVPEVMDVWFDSGAMPLAQFLHPGGASEEERAKIRDGKYFPADFISEAVDQTRGWFYTLHAIATLLCKAGVVKEGIAYRNVICLGHVLDAHGKKMSKSKGNIVDSFEMFDTYGADMLRWFFYSTNQPGLPKRFDVKGMRDVQNRVFRMLWNSYLFFVTYALADNWSPKLQTASSKNQYDQWILSELQLLIEETDKALDRYDVYSATKGIERFIDDLSNWYIRRSRRRFWKSEDDNDKEQAYQTLRIVLVELSKVMAPFTPFISEEIFRNLTGGASVHLAEYPERIAKFDSDLNVQMKRVREVVRQGLQLRMQMKRKVRQPLNMYVLNLKVAKELHDGIVEELNVKVNEIEKVENLPKSDTILWAEIGEIKIGIDSCITPELKREGAAREIIRAIQEGRKKAGFDVSDRISLGYEGMADVFADAELRELIARETLAEKRISEGELQDADYAESVEIDGEKLEFWLKRIL